MGLDSVELVMEFEEAFGVELKDEEAIKLRTPGMVIEPSLVRPGPLVAALYALACAVFLGVFFVALPIGIAGAALYAALGTLVFAFVAILATERCRTRIPQDLRRIRDLVPYAGSSDRIEWTRQKVATVVKVIVMEQLGLSESDYREDADFAKDLGLT